VENEGKSRQNSPDANRVFIVYGRNEKAYNAMQLFIRSLGLSPLGFDEVKNELGGSPFVGDIVESGMRKAKAVVVLFTPDEYAALRPSLEGMSDTPEESARWQSRPNVLFEAGMALMNGPERTVLVTLGDVPLASDMKGRYFFRIGNDINLRAKLRDALLAIECNVNEKVTSWHNVGLAGDFDASISPSFLLEEAVTSPFRASFLALRAWWLDKRITTPISETPVYKAKLSLIFRNESLATIYVQAPIWSGGVGVQSPFGYGYALEITKGEANWDENAKYNLPKNIDPGWSFKLWIGLDPAIPDSDLRKRFDRAQLGSLTVPIKVADKDFRKEFKI